MNPQQLVDLMEAKTRIMTSIILIMILWSQSGTSSIGQPSSGHGRALLILVISKGHPTYCF